MLIAAYFRGTLPSQVKPQPKPSSVSWFWRFCFVFGFSFWHACYTLPSSSSSIESSNNKPNKPMLLWVVAMARRWYTCLPSAKSIASTCCLAGSKRARSWGGGWMVIICMQPAWLALFWELDCFPYCLACCWIMVKRLSTCVIRDDDE